MDSSEGVVFGIIVAVAVGCLSGVISYGAGKAGVREQAIAAGVACYVAKQDGGESVFTWNCP